MRFTDLMSPTRREIGAPRIRYSLTEGHGMIPVRSAGINPHGSSGERDSDGLDLVQPGESMPGLLTRNPTMVFFNHIHMALIQLKTTEDRSRTLSDPVEVQVFERESSHNSRPFKAVIWFPLPARISRGEIR